MSRPWWPRGPRPRGRDAWRWSPGAASPLAARERPRPSTFWALVGGLRDAGLVDPSDPAAAGRLGGLGMQVLLARGEVCAMLLGHPRHPHGSFLLVTTEGAYRVKGGDADDFLAYVTSWFDGRALGVRAPVEVMLWPSLPPVHVVREVLAAWGSADLLTATSTDELALSAAHEPFTLRVATTGTGVGRAAWTVDHASVIRRLAAALGVFDSATLPDD